MTKQTKRLISGTLILSASGLIVKLINILYKWPLTNMVGLETMGYFNTVYSTYLVLTAASLIGIPATISKLVAEEREKENYQEAHRIFKTAFALSFVIGLTVSILFVFLPFYTKIFAWESEVGYVLWGLALSPVLISICGAIRGYFQGMQDMVPTAVSQVIENGIKVAAGVGLVYLFMHKDLPGYISISGATIGISLGFVFTALYLIWAYFRRKDSVLSAGSGTLNSGDKAELSRPKLVSKLLWIAIPITISSAMISIMGFLDSGLIYHIYTAMQDSKENARIALSSVTTAQTVINVPLAISAAISVSVLPAIAVAKVHGDKEELSDKINTAFQLATKMAFPSMVGIFVLAGQILRLLYKNADIAPQLLQLYSICMLFMILAQSVSSILQGLSGYYKSLMAVLVGIVIKTAGLFAFVKAGWQGNGLIASSLLYFLVIFAMNYLFLKKQAEFHLEKATVIIKPLVASLVMGAIVYLTYQVILWIVPSNFMAVVGSVIAAIPVYALTLLLLKGFSKEELLLLPKGKKIVNYLEQRKWLNG